MGMTVELPIHHHDREMYGYVMEGEVTSRVVYIVALPEPAVFAEALVTLDPHERED